LEKAIKVLKHNKEPGLDEKPSKLRRSGEADLIAVLFHLIIEVWNTEQIPLNGRHVLSVHSTKKVRN